MDMVSIGATINVMLAAVKAKGKTIVKMLRVSQKLLILLHY